MALLLAGLVALPLLAEALDEPFYITLMTRVLIFALAAVSLDLILGYGGMVSLGHAAFLGMGAYTAGILTHHAQEGTPVFDVNVFGLDWAWTGSEAVLVVWPAATLAAGLLALVIGAISLRTSGVYFIMITLAFAQMVYFLFVNLDRYGGGDGLSLWGRPLGPGPVELADNTQLYYSALLALVLGLLLCRQILHARFGRVIQGARQDEARMQALGYPTYGYKLACFTLAGALAGLAGALLATQTEFVSPSFLHWTRSGELIVMVLLGGMGTLIGPALGAAAFLLLEEVLADITEHWQVILGPFLIIIVLFARRGLYGLIKGPRDD